MRYYYKFLLISSLVATSVHLRAQELINSMDIFELKYVSNVQISPNGEKIAYLINFKDVMTDDSYSNLWMMNADGSDNQQITKGNYHDSGISWSSKGDRLAYKSDKEGQTIIYIRDLESGEEVSIPATKESPGALAWSPNDEQLAFNMFVSKPQQKFYQLPKKPDSALWNDPPIYIDQLPYRYDASGYVKSGHKQLFVVPCDGREAMQITTDTFNHGPPVWNTNGHALISYALIGPSGTDEPMNTDIYSVDIASGEMTFLTDRKGADELPKISNNGKLIAYLGYDQERMSYQAKHLYLMDINGANSSKVKTPEKFDRSIMSFEWSANDNGLYILFEDHGVLQLSFLDFHGNLTSLSREVGGNYIVRPYTDLGGFSVATDGTYSFNYGSPSSPPEVGIGKDGINRKLTNVNAQFLATKRIGSVEEIWLQSSHDQLDIQAWIVKPPDFSPDKTYPLILQIHGGPHLSYGPYFSFDYQCYAAAGYIVLYMNPRGSTGYGEAFAQKINHAFPSYDYDDLMTAVSNLMPQPYIDQNSMFVTGGSGGGVLSAWITTKSDWFRAAAVIKPVINWYSFLLYSDIPQRFANWFPKNPWEDPDHFLKYSPITYVDHVKTPTLLMTGDTDYRTPIADTEQYYTALKMLGIETVMIRIPNSSHEIDARGSGTVGRLTAILAWFDQHKID